MVYVYSTAYPENVMTKLYPSRLEENVPTGIVIALLDTRVYCDTQYQYLALVPD